LGHDLVANLHGFRGPSIDDDESPSKETERDEEERVGQECLNGQNDHDDTVVAREIARIVGDPRGCLIEIGRARNAVGVEELSNRSQRAQTRLPERLESIGNASQSTKIDACHWEL